MPNVCAYNQDEIWCEAICNVDAQDASKWGWSVEEGRLFPKWQDVKGNSLDINTFTQVCGCKKAIWTRFTIMQKNEHFKNPKFDLTISSI